ncbi:hypothetical protein BLA60_40675 [Actinophytocola xinjiangensis]|uniref:Clp R domain-containing protein n=1 Tax=Actinophytocola xinjiangensis TaxID=485602 RepID=A0A7Z1AT77_9PSEU|nr:hypothetical protein BLA60_40675 [Actinophytocola xinjiangensis]
MFERFTKSARHVVLNAVSEAENDRAERVTAEHLMLSLLRAPAVTASLLADSGVLPEDVRDEFAQARRRAGLTQSEVDALSGLGIDLPSIVSRIEATHGPDALAAPKRRRPHLPGSHIPFADEAKNILTNALVQAKENRDRHISDHHFLLAMAAAPGVPAQILAEHGLTYTAVLRHFAKAG